jgi:hypothetical protein
VLECSICLDYFKIPILHTNCGNLFCTECIKNDICPICQITFEKIHPAPKIILNMLEKFNVKCLTPHCETVLHISDLKEHLNDLCPNIKNIL